MKSLHALLSSLSAQDVRLWVEGDQLRCNAPAGTLTPELRAELTQRKTEILNVLNRATRAVGVMAESIQPVPRTGDLPLSFAQQGLWFIDQLEEGSATYNQLFAVHWQGHLQVSTLQQALTEIGQRHEILRTSFNTVNGQPTQAIADAFDLHLTQIDLQDFPSPRQWNEIEQLAIAESLQPFDLNQAPLMRVKLLQLGPADAVVLFVIHHLIADAWSGAIILQELTTLYAAFGHDQPSPLPTLPFQYVDFAQWQQQHLRGAVLNELFGYWQQQLQGPLPVLELPSDRPRPAIQTYRGATATFQLNPEVAGWLKHFSQQQGGTLFMTLLAAFQVLLYRYTDQVDLCVGTAIATRREQDLESLVGFLVNTVVLRTDLAGHPSFCELMDRVKTVVWGAFNHADLPFHLLVEKLRPERDLAHTPLFQVMFVLENAPIAPIQQPELSLQLLEMPVATAKFDLNLSMREMDQSLVGKFEYNADLFDAATITRMVGHFQTLLAGIAANPQASITQLPLLTPAERQQLLVEWNHTQVEYPQQFGVHHLFENQVEKTPDAVAVTSGNRALTYRQLNQQANQLAHQLMRLGVKPEVLVGICVERSLEMVIGLLGILKAGGAYVPLDPTYPAERLAFMMSDAQVPVLLTTESLIARLPQHSASVVCLDTAQATLASELDENPDSGVQFEHLAYVIYTSGSTGQPKGTLIPHRGLVNYLSWCTQAYAVDEGSGAPVNSALGFDATITSLFSPLLAGRTVVLLSDGHELDALSTVLRSQPDFSLVKITPAHLEILNHQLSDLSANGHTRSLIIGGEALFAHHLSVWRTRAPSTRLINEYGPTETVVGCCVYEVSPQTPELGAIPIGRPIANTQLYLLDQHQQPVPIGIPGELHIGGAGVARGYLNRPDLTAAKFIPHPFSDRPGERLYKTGDLARYRPDGTLEYLGRIDDQVKIRGFRIELGEIETALTQHPQIREAVVMMREDQPGNQRLVAYLVPIPFQTLDLTPSHMRRYVQATLPAYMVPAAFVILDALPLTPNGKVDRRTLPLPEVVAQTDVTYVMPQTEAERRIAEIWQALLQVDRVGIHDNFFDLGGHSLLLIQVQARLQELFAETIPIVELFKYPSIHALAQHFSQSQSSVNAQQAQQRIQQRRDRQTTMQQQRQIRQQRRAMHKSRGGAS
jgi:amino acid adenylation domain-containing protein